MAEVLWYKMEENAANTTVVDNANNSLTGTASVNTSVLTTTGKVGNGFSFTAASLHNITRADSTLLNFAQTGFSAAFWINPTTITTTGIITKGDIATNGFVIYSLVTTNTINCYINGTTHGSTGTLTAATWKHVVVTYDKDKSVKFYINGAFDSGSNQGITLVNNTATMEIGSLVGLSLYYNGKLDDLRIFKRALTLEEVQFLYNSGSGTAVPLDAAVKNVLLSAASPAAIDGSTATGAPVGTDNNKTIAAYEAGNSLGILTLNRPTASPA